MVIIISKFIDLRGQKFGRLTPNEIIREDGRIKWKCLCDCGGYTITTSARLNSGHTRSCGCLQKEKTSQACKKDLTGQKFGRLTIISRESEMGEQAKYLCECECGKTVVVLGCNLVTGATISCGCYREEKTSKLKYSHGKCRSRIYRCWRNMISRCNNQKNAEYKNYGGRGIKVCKLWEKSFYEFYRWAISHGYEDELTIERINIDLGYSPENCKWATMYQQARNRTDNREISFCGRTMIITDWAKEIGISEATIRKRLNSGWSVEDALTKRPNGAGRRRL